jgi:hypothetical protein
MTRIKKVVLSISTLMVLALVVAAMVFTGPRSGQLLSVNPVASTISAPIHSAGNLLADCPGCPIPHG